MNMHIKEVGMSSCGDRSRMVSTPASAILTYGVPVAHFKGILNI